MSYQDKYLKYKYKYHNLLSQIQKGRGRNNYDNCPICIEEFPKLSPEGFNTAKNEDGSLTYGESKCCNNIFHQKCYKIWLNENRSCPMCRAPAQRLGRVTMDFDRLKQISSQLIQKHRTKIESMPELERTSFLADRERRKMEREDRDQRALHFQRLLAQLEPELQNQIKRIANNDPSLVDPDYRTITFVGNIGDVGAQAIAIALETNNTMEEIILSENNIGDIGAQAIATALETNKTLRMLNLEGNNIGDIGAQAIATALLINNTLRTLNLEGNHIGHVGAQALATVLLKNPIPRRNLHELNLSTNNIGDIGAQAIATALETNKTLHLLTLAGNNIGDIGAQAIATALLTNDALYELDLSQNHIGDVGSQALTKSLLTKKEENLSLVI
jgi:hypothetical protein